MTPRRARAQSGITLTEVLISILIMGIGLISLATLFPLGIVRLRDAQRQSRSALLAESATADLGVRGLLYKPSFQVSWYGKPGLGGFDPFTQDYYPSGNTVTVGSNLALPTSGLVINYSGIPVCYDPLWRAQAGVAPPAFGTFAMVNGTTAEARFGAGVVPNGNSFNSFLRADPAGGTPAAHGLQRITNFFLPANASSIATWALQDPTDTFVSLDDPVMQNSSATPQILSGPGGNTNSDVSSLVPQNFAASTNVAPVFQYDFRYTWLFTGYQIDWTVGTVFTGNIVVMDSRPFSYEPAVSPTSGNSSSIAAGETVVEAIYGYSTTVNGIYGAAADRVVLLRWPSNMPDPEIKVGSWFADVTYERMGTRIDALISGNKAPNNYAFQRCNWYQVAKKSEIFVEQNDPGATGYRQVIVYTNTPLRSRTPLQSNGTYSAPLMLNAALIMPSVINVFERTVFVRTDG